MTSSSNLFRNLRSRPSRDHELDHHPPSPALRSPPVHDDAAAELRRRPIRCRSLHRLHRADVCRHPSFLSPSGHHLVISDIGDPNLSRSNSNGVAITSDAAGLGLNRHEQLPSAVLQARARLTERLRSVSLGAPRHRATTSGRPQDESSLRDDIRVTYSIYSRITNPREVYRSGMRHLHLNQVESNINIRKKPPGLSCDVICRLKEETLTSHSEETDAARDSTECSICLECFRDGDRLMWLNCGHKFHGKCIVPWLLSCGDCPYCRANV